MNNSFTIGFKFRDRDYSAIVSTNSTSAFTFFRVNLNDNDLKAEFGPYISFALDALNHNEIKSLKKLSVELENILIDELKRSVL